MECASLISTFIVNCEVSAITPEACSILIVPLEMQQRLTAHLIVNAYFGLPPVSLDLLLMLPEYLL